MKINQIISEMATVAGSVATVSKPMGGTQKRTKIQGLEPAEKVMSGKTKKKGPYANSLSEGKMKDLALDLRRDKDGLSDAEFKKKYGKTKDEMRKSMKEKQVKEADMSRRGFLGTLGKAATAGAALAAGGKALGQEKRSVNISVEEADNQIKALRNQAYQDLASMMWSVWPYILDKKFGNRTPEDDIPNAEEIGKIISNRIGRKLEEYAGEYRKKVHMIKVNAGITDPNSLYKTSAMLESLTEDDLSEQDLIIVPGQKMKRKTGFVPNGQSRVDHEVEMARSDVLATMKNAKSLYQLLKHRSEEEGIEGWVQEKLIKANDYLNAVKEYYDEKMMQEMNGGVIAGGVAFEGKKVDRMVGHIKKSEIKSGKSADKAEDIAWATVNKRGYLDNKNKKKGK